MHSLCLLKTVEDGLFKLQEMERLLIGTALDEKEIHNASRLDQDVLYLFVLDSKGQRDSI